MSKKVEEEYGRKLNLNCSILGNKKKLYVYGDESSIPYKKGVALGTRVFYHPIRRISSPTHEQGHFFEKEIYKSYYNIKKTC